MGWNGMGYWMGCVAMQDAQARTGPEMCVRDTRREGKPRWAARSTAPARACRCTSAVLVQGPRAAPADTLARAGHVCVIFFVPGPAVHAPRSPLLPIRDGRSAKSRCITTAGPLLRVARHASSVSRTTASMLPPLRRPARHAPACSGPQVSSRSAPRPHARPQQKHNTRKRR